MKEKKKTCNSSLQANITIAYPFVPFVRIDTNVPVTPITLSSIIYLDNIALSSIIYLDNTYYLNIIYFNCSTLSNIVHYSFFKKLTFSECYNIMEYNNLLFVL